MLSALFRFFASCYWLQPVRDKGHGTRDMGFDKFLSAEFFRRLGGANLPVSQNLSAECRVQSLNAEIFRQCRSTALQKNHSLFASRYSLLF